MSKKLNFTQFYLLIFILASLLCPIGEVLASDIKEIKKLKPLYIETLLMDNGKANSVIVTPADRYKNEAALLQRELQKAGGSVIPIVSDKTSPEEILKTTHVIVLGNMATNTFIEKLYRQEYVILDLKYPGTGGYNVRSLHNPYGTGRNVIFLGGSDDAGIKAATDVFIHEIKPGNVVKVGWLMKIKISPSFSLPVINANNPKWDVQSWQDSWRITSSGKTGYPPATYFGWNPISIAATLYYMTGEKQYLDCFLELAMPDPRRVPAVLKSSEAFTDPKDPFVKNYHYLTHRTDIIWDLIEESPLLSDTERLFITNKLLLHQRELDPKNTYSVPNGDRHSLYHMLSIYTGSRYFAKYYPNILWNKRINNVRQAFMSLINNPTWGERDTLEWVSTSTEPVFEFFALDGYDEFVKSDTARTMMRALEILMTGDDIDYYNKFISISLLHKAAYLLNDSRYIWMARNLGFDFNVFRIGQSYWPADNVKIAPPTDIINKLLVFYLAKTDWEQAKTAVPLKNAFQVLAYRNGLTAADDYFLLDGFNGMGRNPSHINNLTRLRMFHGKNILGGYSNDISIWRNGMVDSYVAKSAGIKDSLTVSGAAFVHTEVPDAMSSNWQRYIFYQPQMTIVIDKVTARDEGLFDVQCLWQFGADIKYLNAPFRWVSLNNGTRLTTTADALTIIDQKSVSESFTGKLTVNENIMFANIFHHALKLQSITEIKPGAYSVSGVEDAFVSVGGYSSSLASLIADFVYLGKQKVMLANATEISFKNEALIKSDKPVTCLWEFENDELTIKGQIGSKIVIKGKDGLKQITLDKNEISVSVSVSPNTLIQIEAFIDQNHISLKSEKVRRVEPQISAGSELRPLWTIKLKDAVSHIGIAESDSTFNIWVATNGKATSNIVQLDQSGKITNEISNSAKVLSIFTPQTKSQKKAFSILIGDSEDQLKAFSKEGKELWRVKAASHDSFKIGDRYEAPWFTDPRPPYNMKGIYSICIADLGDNGKEEIVIGRPSTLEFRSLKGDLIESVPTRWGNNTALAVLRDRGSSSKESLLLAGKFFTGNPQLSGVNINHKNVSDKLFAELLPGYTNMHAWLQRGISQILTSDLNKDGVDDVVYTISGNWNELRVYDGKTRTPVWIRYFGPDKTGKSFMRGLVISDLRGNGSNIIVSGTKNGWLSAFSTTGDLLWQHHFETSISAMNVSIDERRLIVGCENGEVFFVNAKGESTTITNFGVSVTAISSYENHLFLAGENGEIRSYIVKD